MADFSSGVTPPGGMSYAAPLLSFQQFSNWAADDPYKKIFDQQQQQLNQQRLQQGQQQLDVAGTFKGGLPMDPATGQIDYKKAVAMLAAKGDINSLWNGADAMLSQSAMGVSPLLSGGGAQPAAGGAPASVPARPLPPAAANSPKGDPGTGTVTDLVTARMPAEDTATGQTIGKIAQTLGVDPNAVLTPGQIRRAEGLLKRYAPAADGAGGAAGGTAPASAPSFNDRFSGDGGGGDLPPSANAVSPAPRGTTPPAPGGGSAAQPGAPQPAQQPQAPIVPQVPLPKGFTDPQQAILALRAEAARLSANPHAQGQVQALNNYAQRIEQSLQPVKAGQYDTYLDPKTSQPIYQGPGAAALAAAGSAGSSATLDADAETYRQTGKLPPNMGRGLQGAAEAHAIRNRAVEQELAEGGDPSDWSSRWQNFQTQATGKRVLEQRAVGLSLAENEASKLLPRVREASAKVSRTEYPTLNSLVLAAQKGSGGKDVIKLGIAVASLIPVYARVMKPVGQITEGDTHRASDILDKAWSDGQINAALDQMEIELKSARSALDKTMEDAASRTGRRGPGAAGNASAPAAPASATAKEWVRGPDGKLGPAP